MAMNIVIPMAGRGSRFSDVGYTTPKPLITVNGKHMIELVIDNMAVTGANYIFIVQRHHYTKYNLQDLLSNLVKKFESVCKIIITDEVTEGPACSVLLAKEYINDSLPLVIANSDQYIDWGKNDIKKIVDIMSKYDVDGCISTFTSSDPKFSYAHVINDVVTHVAEKDVISNHASTGIYFWKRGSDFVRYAEQMILNGIRQKNEYYVGPIYNLSIEDGKTIIVSGCNKFYCLGTPADLQNYLKKD